MKGLVEKPKQAEAPSNKIISGRYILQPEVMRTLENQGKGAGGEIHLTDAMARMIGSQPFHAVTFAGRRFDCGSKLGFVEATLALALEREDKGADVRAMAQRLLGKRLQAKRGRAQSSAGECGITPERRSTGKAGASQRQRVSWH